MKNIILCDLDGTLADIRHRLHYIANTQPCPACTVDTPVICPACDDMGFVKRTPDWEGFHAACADDKPIRDTIDAVDFMKRGMTECLGSSVELWITSGRSDSVRGETVRWLHQCGVPHDRLIMRPHGDHTPDDILKRSWLNTIIPKDRVLCVFDDRKRVVDMWREQGLTCYQVAPGEF